MNAADKIANQKTILSVLPATTLTAFHEVAVCLSVVRKHLSEMLKCGFVEVVELEDGKRRVFAPTQAGCEQFALPMPGKRQTPARRQTPAQTLTSCWMGFKPTEEAL